MLQKQVSEKSETLPFKFRNKIVNSLINFAVICAFLFYSPCLVWRALYTKSGIRIKDIVAFANDRSNIQPSNF